MSCVSDRISDEHDPVRFEGSDRRGVHSQPRGQEQGHDQDSTSIHPVNDLNDVGSPGKVKRKPKPPERAPTGAISRLANLGRER
jgi:hypothetical protein